MIRLSWCVRLSGDEVEPVGPVAALPWTGRSRVRSGRRFSNEWVLHPGRSGTAMKDVHKRPRELREDRGLSLRQTASRVVGDGGHGISHDSVRNYEAGRSNPSDYLIAVCSTFHVSPDWLLFGRGSMRDRPTEDASAALEAVGDIVRAFRGEREDWRSDGWTGATLRRWHQFVGALGGDGPVTTMSLESSQPLWPPASCELSPDTSPRRRPATREARGR